MVNSSSDACWWSTLTSRPPVSYIPRLIVPSKGGGTKLIRTLGVGVAVAIAVGTAVTDADSIGVGDIVASGDGDGVVDSWAIATNIGPAIAKHAIRNAQPGIRITNDNNAN